MNRTSFSIFPAGAQPLFSLSDTEGFFCLMVDNLVQFLIIVILLTGLIGMPRESVISSVLPAVAVSLLVGNLYYAWLAQKLSAETGRKDVTALPYGINTISMFAFIFLVMLPAKLLALESGLDEEQAATVAWRAGVAACFVSGAMELLGSAVAERVRKATPRAALLASLAGIAMVFLCMDFAARCFAYPLVALFSFGVLLFALLSRTRLPFGIPGVGLALALGTAAAWALCAAGAESATSVSAGAVSEAAADLGFHVPVPVVGDLVAGLSDPVVRSALIPVVLPMGLFNILGSLQNIESAEAAGDSYPTGRCLAANGVGSVAASLFGSCFPTTIYIGHPGWKEMGARGGYSVINGVFYTAVSVLGLGSLVAALAPVEAAGIILVWIGLVMAAQAFQSTPRAHAPAVALGFMPALAAWATLLVSQTAAVLAGAAGDFSVAARAFENPGTFVAAGLQLPGLAALSQGFMLSSIVWAATAVCLVERRFARAAAWMAAGAAMAFFGLIHAGGFSPEGTLVYSPGFAAGAKWAAGYALTSAFFLAVSFRGRETS